MKTTIYMAIVFAGALAACEKEKTCPVPADPTSVFHTQLQGSYQMVGFKNDLFPDWSYTNSGPVISITADSITEPFSSKYQVMDNNTIFMNAQNQLVDVSFGDTVLFAFQNGDSTKLVKQ
jgi:hypothetical protein